MKTFKNVQSLSAEELYHILQSDFGDAVNSKLDSSLNIEYAHVYDVINIHFPDIKDTVFTIRVNEDEIELSNNGLNTEYNTDLLEQQITDFLNEKCS